MAIRKRPAWDEGSVYKASDGKLYIVLEASVHTVTVMRVAWMWDKDDDLDLSAVTDTRRRAEIYRTLRDKYTQRLGRHGSTSGYEGTHAAEHLLLAEGSTLRSTSRLGPAALKRLEDAAGVRKFRIVRATFSGPITSPVDALFRKYNEYSPISPDDPGNPKLHAIFGTMSDLLEEGVLPPHLVEAFIARIEAEFRDFHSPSVPSRAVERWKKDPMIERLYSDSVKVNQAYWKRAERYVRRIVSEDAGQQNTAKLEV